MLTYEMIVPQRAATPHVLAAVEIGSAMVGRSGAEGCWNMRRSPHTGDLPSRMPAKTQNGRVSAVVARDERDGRSKADSRRGDAYTGQTLHRTTAEEGAGGLFDRSRGGY